MSDAGSNFSADDSNDISFSSENSSIDSSIVDSQSDNDSTDLISDYSSDLDSDFPSSEEESNSGDESDYFSSDDEFPLYNNMDDINDHNLTPDLIHSTQPVEGLGDEIGQGVLAIPIGGINFDNETIMRGMQKSWDRMVLEDYPKYQPRTMYHSGHLLNWSRLGRRYIATDPNGKREIFRTFTRQMRETRYSNGNVKPRRIQKIEQRRKLNALLKIADNVTPQALLRTGCDWNYIRYGRIRYENALKRH